MNWLNQIGQRKIANYLIGASVLISLIIYGIKLNIGNNNTNATPGIIAIIFGVVIFSLGNILLSVAAHKSKEHRLMALFASATIVVLNGVLFALSLKTQALSFFLFIIALIEIAFSGIFFLYVIKSEKERNKRKIYKTKSTKSITENNTESNIDNITENTETKNNQLEN